MWFPLGRDRRAARHDRGRSHHPPGTDARGAPCRRWRSLRSTQPPGVFARFATLRDQGEAEDISSRRCSRRPGGRRAAEARRGAATSSPAELTRSRAIDRLRGRQSRPEAASESSAGRRPASTWRCRSTNSCRSRAAPARRQGGDDEGAVGPPARRDRAGLLRGGSRTSRLPSGLSCRWAR